RKLLRIYSGHNDANRSSRSAVKMSSSARLHPVRRRSWQPQEFAAPRLSRQEPMSRAPSILLANSNSYDCLDDCVSVGGRDLQLAANLAQTLAHARQSNSARGICIACSLTQAPDAASLGHADARVLDRQHNTLSI